jgi:hypothetical protein
MFLRQRKEAPAPMHSSATVAARALVMLACAIGIPILAMSGSSWSEIVKKFEGFRMPTILDPAAASTPSTAPEPPRLATHGSAVDAQFAHSTRTTASAVSLPSGPATAPAGDTVVGPECRAIGDRLQRLGATYYVLESWGDAGQVYRFYCTVATGGNANYSHGFEAIRADPLQAMQDVLQQVETRHGATIR